jgi:hypothetical protein
VFGGSMKNRFISKELEESLTHFLLKFSMSNYWLLFGLSALALFVLMGQSLFFSNFIDEHPLGVVAEAYILIGVLLTWFAAQVFTYKNGKRGLHIAIFILWPLSYIYLIYLQFIVSRRRKNT